MRGNFSFPRLSGLISVFLLFLLASGSSTTFPRHVRRCLASSAITVATLLPQVVAWAQIPDMDQFYETSGTKVRDVVAAKAPPAPEAPFTSLSQLGPALDRLEELIKREAWDDVVAERKRNPALRALQKVDFGLRAAELHDLEDARQELDFSVSQVLDACLQQRVLYFNKEDLKQVSRMLEDDGGGKKPAVAAPTSEVLALLKEARATLANMK